jgi:pimeloyl-ACP methyl ester carboxylesterase
LTCGIISPSLASLQEGENTMLPTRRAMLLATAAAVVFISPAVAENAWDKLPAPAVLPKAKASGLLDVNGVKIYHEIHGAAGPWVIMLHGGLGIVDYWGNQVPDLAADHQVLLIESRGHGRSSRDDKTYTYELMASDVVAVMDQLGIAKASVVGWSDGGIIALVMALNNPDRLEKIVALGANSDPTGVDMQVAGGATFGQYVTNAGANYAKVSPTPTAYDDFVKAISKMWETEPNITDKLANIKTPTLIMAGQYDVITQAHTKMMAGKIPGAKLEIVPSTAHFVIWQDPASFNRSVRAFLIAM